MQLECISIFQSFLFFFFVKFTVQQICDFVMSVLVHCKFRDGPNRNCYFEKQCAITFFTTKHSGRQVSFLLYICEAEHLSSPVLLSRKKSSYFSCRGWISTTGQVYGLIRSLSMVYDRLVHGVNYNVKHSEKDFNINFKKHLLDSFLLGLLFLLLNM